MLKIGIIVLIIMFNMGCDKKFQTNTEFVMKIGCHDKENSEKYIEYKEIIEAIDRSVGEMFNYGHEIWTDTFIELYESPSKYLYEATCHILDPNATRQQKVITVYAMKRLPKEELMLFGRSLYQGYKRGIVDGHVLNFLIFDGLKKPNGYIENYADRDVRLLLISIQRDKTLDQDFRKGISEILSGRLLEDFRDYFGD